MSPSLAPRCAASGSARPIVISGLDGPYSTASLAQIRKQDMVEIFSKDQVDHLISPRDAATYCGIPSKIFRHEIAPKLDLLTDESGRSAYSTKNIGVVVFGDTPEWPGATNCFDEYALSIANAVGDLASTTRKRAKLKGWDCDIDRAYIEQAIEAQDFTCAMTGIRFDVSPHPVANKRPWAPSVDRIDRSKGYTRDNVRIICAAVNLAMNVWNEDVLIAIAEGIIGTREDR